MSTAEQEREIEIVVGRIGGITQKRPDTWTVEVTPDGSQYSRNLWSKNVALVQAIQERYLQQRLVFTCGVSHWTNAQGQPVRSLWINEANEAPPEGTMQTVGQVMQQQPVAQQATVTQLPQAQPQQQPQRTAPDPEAERQVRIMRQAAAKCAVWELPTLPPEERTFPHLVMIAEGWYAYFTRGPEVVPNLPPQGEVKGTGTVQMAVPGLAEGEMQQASPIGQYQPDDIPF